MNTASPTISCPKVNYTHAPRGFALIATISVMVLLVMIALSMLSLSTITLRSSKQDAAMETAQANARMSLMIALGELQKYAGPDQRITAPSSILDKSIKQPNWTGVWSSKERGNLPVWLVSGNESASISNFDGLSSYPADYQQPDSVPAGDTFDLFKGDTASDVVTVSLVDTVNKKGEQGRYAYWVSDEGAKARVDLETPAGDALEPTARLARARVPQEAGLGNVHSDLDPLSDKNAKFKKSSLVSYGSIDLALDDKEGVISSKYAHDLTLGGYGLPTNVVQGGMKADLSILFDSSQHDESQMLQKYMGASPTAKAIAGTPGIDSFTNVSDPDKFYLVPQLRGSEGKPVGPNWGILYNYSQLWKHVSGGSAAPFSFDPPLVTDLRSNDWPAYQAHNKSQWARDVQHTNSSLSPILCVMQMGFRISATPATIPGTNPAVQGYHLQLQMKPLIGFWNPYNVKIRSRSKDLQWALYPHIRINADCPKLASQPNHWFGQRPRRIRTNVWMRDHWKFGSGVSTQENTGARLFMETPEIDFEPGEILLFSVEDSAEMDQKNKLVPTWNESGGFNFNLVYSDASVGDGTSDQGDPNSSNKGIIVPEGSKIFFGSTWMEDTIHPQTKIHFGNEVIDGVTASYITVGGGVEHITHRVSDIWQPMTLSGRETGDVQNGNTWVVPDPVISTWVKSGGNQTADKIPAGLLAATPYHIGTWRFFSRTATEAMPAEANAGSQRLRTWIDSNPRFGPMNPRWDGSRIKDGSMEGFNFISPFIGGSLEDDPWDGGPRGRGLVAEGQDESGSFPEATLDGGRYRGFGGLSSSSSGQNHVALFDVPRAPLVSLGQLQHAQLSRYGFEPAFPLGNSYANIRIPLDQTLVENYAGLEGMRMVDTSHALNGRLWDGYFFSTIGVDYKGKGQSGDIDSHYPAAGLANGEVQLANPRHLYIPINGNTSISDIIDRSDNEGPQALAARIAVQGAFNVNSTSVNAWKAVLASLANYEFPVISQNGLNVSWNDSAGVRFPRFGHPMQADGWTAGKGQENPAFWTGFREVSSEELDSLAENIVEEIRKRGPFRSFADFVNRDPESNDQEIQRKGVLQAALDKSLNHPIQTTVGDKADKPQGGHFSDAMDNADGTAAGFAGYLTQGDLLQTLAPVLQVRSDFFRIRAVGQATNQQGDVIATAICEAYVQRGASYVDAGDDAHIDADSLDQEPNKQFGRRFKIVSFRWLATSEV